MSGDAGERERRYIMNKGIAATYSNLARTVIKGLESRNMTGYYAETKEEALNIALSLIPEGSTVTMGGAISCQEIGLVDAIKNGNYTFLLPGHGPNRRQECIEAYGADVFLSSCNAMTNDGILVNIDGNSNRVSCIAYGPEKVVMVVSMNKVCADVDSAIKRARNVAAPMNATRLGAETPCTKVGKCMDCKSPGTICCHFLVTRFSRHPGRIHVILVGEDLGL